MKKLTMLFVTVLMFAGLSASALADPGWSNGNRYGNRDRYERPQYQYDHRDYRDYRVAYRRVIVHRLPVRPPEPFVHVVRPHVPIFTFLFPHMSIQIR
jgi:hypothetical protein